MKYLFITICSVLFFSCSQRADNSQEVIESFVSNIYLSDNASIEAIHKYMTKEFIKKYNSLSIEKKKIHEQYITEFAKKVRKTLIENDNKFEIMSLQELEKSKLDYIRISYMGNGDVYGFVSGGMNLFFFIIEDGKIHSFCSDIYLSSKEESIPYFFFERT